MTESEFDKSVCGDIAKAINSKIEPAVVMGILEANKLDVFLHLKNSQRVVKQAQNGELKVLTPEQLSALQKKQPGRN